jgi:hypothetical protein
MRASIARVIIMHAIDALKRSRQAKHDNYPDEEMRQAVAAYLMIAITIEGIGNEIGEATLSAWEWERLERSETPLKWRIISSADRRTPFNPGGEPLQTVQKLAGIRNRIAHPKTADMGDEIIVRSADGHVRRNVSGEELMKEGDHLIPGYNKLIDEFTYTQALLDVTKGVAAIKSLRDHLSASGLEWLEQIDNELIVLRQNP